MATVMLMEWPGVTPEQYTRVMASLGLDAAPAPGGMLHVAGFAGGSLYVVDIWDAQHSFERFQKERLASAVQKEGITTQPKVVYFPAHNFFAPDLEEIQKTGVSSLPAPR